MRIVRRLRLGGLAPVQLDYLANRVAVACRRAVQSGFPVTEAVELFLLIQDRTDQEYVARGAVLLGADSDTVRASLGRARDRLGSPPAQRNWWPWVIGGIAVAAVYGMRR